jgi:HEAT repeat protein
MMSFIEDLFSGSADVETLKAKRNVRGLVRTLKNDDQNVRATAIQALGEVGDARAVEPLATLFKEEPFLVAEALKNIGMPAFDALLAGLKYEEKEIRWAAAKMLGELGDPRTTEPLLSALRDPDKGVRQVAVEALSHNPDARTLEVLKSLLNDPSLEVRTVAVETLGKAGGAQVIGALFPLLSDLDWNIRQTTAAALERMGWSPTPDETGAAYWAAKHWWSRCAECGPDALKPLTLALKDQPYSVAEAMEKLGPLAAPPLIAALHSDISDVRRAAAKSLGALKELRSLDALCAAVKDPDAMVRQLAVVALGQIGHEQALDPLLAALTDETLHTEAIKALGQIQGEQVVPTLIAHLQNPDKKAAQASIDLLGQTQDKRAGPPLLALLKNPEPEMRLAAIEALGKLGDPVAVEPLITLFHSIDGADREAAALALGRLKDSRAVPVLTAALPEADKDLLPAVTEALGLLGPSSVSALIQALRVPAARYGAADALSKIGAAAVPALLPLVQDPVVEVRHMAVEVLGHIGDDRAMAPLIGALKDESIRYSAAEALWKIGVSPELKSVVTLFRDKEQNDMLTALRSLCDAYLLKDAAAIAELEPRVRQIGFELNRRGGVPAMQRLFDEVQARDGAPRAAKLWNGIGDWRS